MALYTPYGEEFPRQQATLLEMWDEVRIPHRQVKQLFGSRLAILRIDVDVEEMSFTLPEDLKRRLIEELEEWCQKGIRKKVKEWQRLAGWLNWALNIYPLLRPVLNNVYGKI